MEKFYNLNIEDDYTIEILDQNIKEFILDSKKNKDGIMLSKNNYKILNKCVMV